MTSTTMPLLVTQEEAARMMGISLRKIQALTTSRELPSLKIDRCRRYSVESIVNWIRTREAAEGQQINGHGM